MDHQERLRLGKRRIFAGKLLQVFVERVKLPNGSIVVFERIRHPGASAVVPFLSGNAVVLIRQLRPVIGSSIWEIPAGTLKTRESPLECARREIIEEIGYAAGALKERGFIYTTPGFTDEKIWLFEARRLRRVPHRLEDDEIIAAKVFSPREIRSLFRNGRIVDAKTIAALVRCSVL